MKTDLKTKYNLFIKKLKPTKVEETNETNNVEDSIDLNSSFHEHYIYSNKLIDSTLEPIPVPAKLPEPEKNLKEDQFHITFDAAEPKILDDSIEIQLNNVDKFIFESHDFEPTLPVEQEVNKEIIEENKILQLENERIRAQQQKFLKERNEFSREIKLLVSELENERVKFKEQVVNKEQIAEQNKQLEEHLKLEKQKLLEQTLAFEQIAKQNKLLEQKLRAEVSAMNHHESINTNLSNELKELIEELESNISNKK